MDDWTTQLDSGGQIDVIYTDLAKAFDTVPHHRLLLKLKTYNINEDLIVWISDFLCNRKQCQRSCSLFSDSCYFTLESSAYFYCTG